jgi:hypothetical protein
MARRDWPEAEPLVEPIRLTIQVEIATLLTRNVLSLARLALREVEAYGGEPGQSRALPRNR